MRWHGGESEGETRSRRRIPGPATEGGTNGITSRDRRRREVQSVTNPASTRGRQGDNLCGACFVLFWGRSPDATTTRSPFLHVCLPVPIPCLAYFRGSEIPPGDRHDEQYSFLFPAFARPSRCTSRGQESRNHPCRFDEGIWERRSIIPKKDIYIRLTRLLLNAKKTQNVNLRHFYINSVILTYAIDFKLVYFKVERIQKMFRANRSSENYLFIRELRISYIK